MRDRHREREGQAHPDDQAAQGEASDSATTTTPESDGEPQSIADVLANGHKVRVATLVEWGASTTNVIGGGYGLLVAREAHRQGMAPDALTADEVAAIGDAVVEAGKLEYYTAARYGSGRWVGASTAKAARKALKAMQS